MNKKRIATVIAAATMLLNVTPVMAAQPASGSATVSGSGTVNAYDQTPIYVVTLPTANALDFTVDPYGLLDLASGSAINIDDLTNTGAIVSASGAAAVIRNESSVPITVSLTLTATQPTANQAIDFKATGSEVATGTAANMFLAIIPSAEKADSASTYQAASYAIPATTAPSRADAKFKLDKAEYEVINNGGSFAMQIVSGTSNYDATTFKVGGYVNPKADWTDFMSGKGSSVALSVVFSYEKSADSDVVDENSGVYGLVSGSAANITDDLGVMAAISGTGMKASNAEGVDFEITGFSVSKAYTIKVNDGRSITSAKIGANTTKFDTIVNNTNINNTANTVTIPANTMGAGAVTAGSRYLQLVTSEGTLIVKLNCIN